MQILDGDLAGVKGVQKTLGRYEVTGEVSQIGSENEGLLSGLTTPSQIAPERAPRPSRIACISGCF